VAGAVLLFGAGTVALDAGVHIGTGAALLALAAGTVARAVCESLRAYRQRARLRQQFAGYVSPAVLSEILAGNIEPRLQGMRREVCILFSDIRGFTTRSEGATPEEIVTLLNEYFEEMAAAVHARDGTVDKFIGDGMMAFFGAPNARSNPSLDAFHAAVDMFERLQTTNTTLASRGVTPITNGVGLHLGVAVIGHVGSRDRYEYTAIGDAVNVAARIEGLTKDAGHPLLCSDTVAARLPSGLGLVKLGLFPIKGRAPIAVHGWSPPPLRQG
jgi:class 3 adenylate cyclase